MVFSSSCCRCRVRWGRGTHTAIPSCFSRQAKDKGRNRPLSTTRHLKCLSMALCIVSTLQCVLLLLHYVSGTTTTIIKYSRSTMDHHGPTRGTKISSQSPRPFHLHGPVKTKKLRKPTRAYHNLMLLCPYPEKRELVLQKTTIPS